MKKITLPNGWTLSKRTKMCNIIDTTRRGWKYIYAYLLTDMDGYIRVVDSLDEVRRILANHGYQVTV